MHMAALALQIESASGLWILSYESTQVNIWVSCCHPSEEMEKKKKSEMSEKKRIKKKIEKRWNKMKNKKYKRSTNNSL